MAKGLISTSFSVGRRTLLVPVLLDDEEAARQAERKREEIQRYRAAREEVERQRELDRQERNQIKRSQIELFERMQVRRVALGTRCRAGASL